MSTSWRITPILISMSVLVSYALLLFFFFFQAEDGIRDVAVTGVQTCALPICAHVLGVRGVQARLLDGAHTAALGLLDALAGGRRVGVGPRRGAGDRDPEIGRASCRERV